MSSGDSPNHAVMPTRYSAGSVREHRPASTCIIFSVTGYLTMYGGFDRPHSRDGGPRRTGISTSMPAAARRNGTMNFSTWSSDDGLKM